MVKVMVYILRKKDILIFKLGGLFVPRLLSPGYISLGKVFSFVSFVFCFLFFECLWLYFAKMWLTLDGVVVFMEEFFAWNLF